MGRPIKLKDEAYAQYVIEKASDISGVPVSLIVSPTRKREAAIARHAICFALVSTFDFTYEQAIRVLGRINHTTAKHSYELVLDQMSLVNRSEDMDSMVSLAQQLVRYSENELSKINPMTDRRKREMGAAMRGQQCHYMSVVGILTDGKLVTKDIAKNVL